MKVLIGSLLVVLFFTPLVFASGEPEDKGDLMMKNEDVMMKPDDTLLPDERGFFDTRALQPRVIPYTTEAAAQTLAQKTRVVYFFAATWCPTCQAAMRNIKAGITSIPDDVTLVLVNYDTQGDLKGTCGVVVQHTFVQIDAKGMIQNAWVGSTTVADILRQIKM